jgi:TM2 domain-containing membrane protein YozV
MPVRKDATIVGDEWEPMSEPTVSLRNPAKAAFLAWLVPGLGHFYQGRTGKGILYAVCILGLYVMGMVMGEGKVVYWRWVNPFNNPEKFCLYYLGQFFAGLPALPALIQSTLHELKLPPILWGFMAEPPQTVLNGLQRHLGKLVEIGTIYTTVAGLLNILAIYDAYEGPAYQDFEEEAAPRSTAQPLPAAGLRPEGSA